MLIDFQNLGGYLSIDQTLHYSLAPLVEVAQDFNRRVPEECLWEIKYPDDKYLTNSAWSPAIETYRIEGGHRVKMSGPCHVEPTLDHWHIKEIEFLGGETAEGARCSCYWTAPLSEKDATNKFASALSVLYLIYGISESCRLAGSSQHVIDALANIESAALTKRRAAVRLKASFKARGDLR